PLTAPHEVVPLDRIREPRQVAGLRAVAQHDGALHGRKLRPDLLDRLEPVEVAPVVAVAVDGEQDLRLDLLKAVDDAARAEVGRAARPGRADARAREEGRGRL